MGGQAHPALETPAAQALNSNPQTLERYAAAKEMVNVTAPISGGNPHKP